MDGNWSPWTEWGQCTETCGDEGMKIRHRSCNDPSPSCNGLPCDGPNSETEPCNIDVECPGMRAIDG